MKKLLLLFGLLVGISGARAQWVSNGPKGQDVTSLLATGTVIYAGCSNGVFQSPNNGRGWGQLNRGLADTLVECLAASGNTIFAGTENGVYITTNGGNNWTKSSTGLPFYTSVPSLLVTDSGIFAGTLSAGVYRSIDNGGNWQLADSGMPHYNTIFSLARSGQTVFAGTEGGLFLSANWGLSWVPADTGLPYNTVLSLAGSDSTAATGQARIYAGTSSDGVFVSPVNPINWAAADSGITFSTITAFAVCDSGLPTGTGGVFAATGGGGLFLSTNYGLSWTTVNTGLSGIYSLTVNSTTVFAGTSNGVWQAPLNEVASGIAAEPVPVQAGFSIYPNPCSGSGVQCSVPDELLGSVMDLYDVQGRLVFNSELRTRNSALNFNLAPGVYIAMLKTGTGVLAQKLVVER